MIVASPTLLAYEGYTGRSSPISGQARWPARRTQHSRVACARTGKGRLPDSRKASAPTASKRGSAAIKLTITTHGTRNDHGVSLIRNSCFRGWTSSSALSVWWLFANLAEPGQICVPRAEITKVGNESGNRGHLEVSNNL